MGVFEFEMEPGAEGLKACPECGQRAVGAKSASLLSKTEYYCDSCGYEPTKKEVTLSIQDALGGASLNSDETDVTDPDLKQQVEDRQAEGWKIEEVTDSGRRVVMSTTKGGSVGGHAVTGFLTGLWTFGLGNAAYGKLSKKRNRQRVVLRADDEAGTGEYNSIAVIRELKQLNEEGIITDDEFEEKRRELLEDI